MLRMQYPAVLLLEAVLVLAGSACTQLPDSGGPHVWEWESGPTAARGTSELASCSITGWTAAGSMRVPRQRYATVLLPSGEVLVTGGYADDALGNRSFTASSELYSPTSDSWSDVGSMSLSRLDHTATLLASGQVLITGGVNGSSSPKYPATAELYTPSTRSWTPTGAMSTNRASHTATLLPSGKVLVAGGLLNSSQSLATAELYDPATGSWTPTGSMATGRAHHTATLLNSGTVLVTGGSIVAAGVETGETASAETYDPDTGAWTSAGNMAVVRVNSSATLLPSGKVLIMGGYTDFPSWTFYASAELYDPQTHQWSAASSACASRHGHSAVVLQSGKVLVVGGYPAGVISELYDPATDAWTTVPTLSIPRTYASATRLPSGRVLVVGGYARATLSSAETYQEP